MYSNEDIINGLINNNQDVIKKTYRVLLNVINNWIRKNNGYYEDAADILQEAFIIVLNKIKTDGLKLECSFSTYIFSICKHLWFQELRYRSRYIQKEAGDFHIITGIVDDSEFEQRKMYIYIDQINKLEAKCRDLLLLYCQNKSLTEIMNILGFKNQQAVADKKKNCRKKLIKNLLNCKEYKELQDEISG